MSLSHKFSTTFGKRWLSDPTTYPIVGALVGATALATFFGGRRLFTAPETTWNKENRIDWEKTTQHYETSGKNWNETNSVVKSVVHKLNSMYATVGLVHDQAETHKNRVNKN